MSTPQAAKERLDPASAAAFSGTLSSVQTGIARDLLRRSELADAARSDPDGERTEEQRAELRRTDRADVEVLRSVLAVHGWPGITLVGVEAARAAWLIVLRCDDAEFQSAVLPVLADAVATGEAEPAWWAHLYDRCCALTGVEQWFGTQFRRGRDGVEVYPVDDPENLDGRRAEYGLGPHAAKTAELRERYGRASACPVTSGPGRFMPYVTPFRSERLIRSYRDEVPGDPSQRTPTGDATATGRRHGARSRWARSAG